MDTHPATKETDAAWAVIRTGGHADRENSLLPGEQGRGRLGDLPPDEIKLAAEFLDEDEDEFLDEDEDEAEAAAEEEEEEEKRGRPRTASTIFHNGPCHLLRAEGGAQQLNMSPSFDLESAAFMKLCVEAKACRAGSTVTLVTNDDVNNPDLHDLSDNFAGSAALVRYVVAPGDSPDSAPFVRHEGKVYELTAQSVTGTEAYFSFLAHQERFRAECEANIAEGMAEAEATAQAEEKMVAAVAELGLDGTWDNPDHSQVPCMSSRHSRVTHLALQPLPVICRETHCSIRPA
jgi:hypothetical protein